MGVYFTAECIEFDPRIVRVTVHAPDGTPLFTQEFNRSDYVALAAVSQGTLPPDPCA